MDILEKYAESLGFRAARKILLVEGTTDYDLFVRAARFEFEAAGTQLLGPELSIVASGQGDAGGTHGVLQQLTTLRGLAKLCLGQSGTPLYRIVALFDNDRAGQKAVKAARDFDKSVLEYKDVFRLRPKMPRPTSLDPISLQRSFTQENAACKDLEWELEDLLPQSFHAAFAEENPTAQIKVIERDGFRHWEYTRDGKARFQRYVRANAIRADLTAVCDVLRAMRHYLNLRPV